MDLRQLRNFLAVAEEANVGRAARRINLSQPALSRQIMALEVEIGFALFDRSIKSIRLTEAGRAYEADVRRIVAELDGSARVARDVAAGRAGQMRIGIFGSAILDFIPKVINRFSKACPDARLTLRLLDKDQQIEGLRRGQLDLGFNRLVPDEPDIVVERVWSEPLLFVTRCDNRLGALENVPIEAILNEPLILYPSGVRSSLMNKILELFLRHGVTPNVAHEVPDPITALGLVAGGLGSALMPRAVARLQLPELSFRPFSANGPVEVNLACLYARDNPSPSVGIILEIIRSLAREQEDGY